jgi:hypothetical protein
MSNNNNQGWGKNISASECAWSNNKSQLDPNSLWGRPIPPMTDEEREMMYLAESEFSEWVDPMEKIDEWLEWDVETTTNENFLKAVEQHKRNKRN